MFLMNSLSHSNQDVEPKYGENAKHFGIDTDNFIAHLKTEDIYKDFAEDVETRFDTSNFELDRPLTEGKNGNVIGLVKDKLCGQIMREFVGLKAKIQSYLKDNNDKDQKQKAQKSVS